MSTRNSHKKRGGPSSVRTSTTINIGSKRGASSRSTAATRNKRSRQDDDDDAVLTRSDIPAIIAAIRDAARSESEALTATHLPCSSSMTTGTAPTLTGATSSLRTARPRSTSTDTTRNAYPTAADEMQLQELGK